MGLKRLVLGARQTIAGTVYGTIVVLASLTAGAKAFQDNLWRLVAVAGATTLVLWLGHVYAHGLGESLNFGRRLTGTELAAIARRELSIPLAAVLPLAVVALGAAGLLRDSTALWLAFGVGLATLAAQGVRYARVERLGLAGTIISVALNLSLGLVIVAMKVIVLH
jgi:hypothetical protein